MLPSGLIWNFSYPEYLAVFKRACRAWGLEGVVPYQMRHSGPSIDRANKTCSLMECQKRGRWKSWQSVTRYEKSARLAVVWSQLPRGVQERLATCERELEKFMLGRRGAPWHVVPG